MEPNVLLELPDTALYQLLTAMKVKDVLRVCEVFGDRRSGVFVQTEHYFQTKYHLPGLSLVKIGQIVKYTDAYTSLREAFRFGDYPKYALSLYKELDEPFGSVEEVLKAGREESAIALLKENPDHLAFFFALALNYRCPNFLRYLLSFNDFSAMLLKQIHRIKDEDVDWALTTIKPKINEWVLTRILGGKVYTPAFFATLLTLMTDEELLKAENVHRQAVATTRSVAMIIFTEEKRATSSKRREKEGVYEPCLKSATQLTCV